MPFVLCKTHGGAPAPLVCKHIAENVKNSIPVEQPFHVQADYLGQSAWGVYLCGECAKKHGISERLTKLEGESGLDQIFGIDGQVPICGACLAHCCQNLPRRTFLISD
jgi:hypothetical protein